MKHLLAPLAAAALTCAAQSYTPGPDSQPQPGVPTGRVTQHSWTSKIFPGTTRDYWLYIPAQYNASTPAAVMVIQDGGGFVSAGSRWKANVVMDNLIHRKEMPVTIGIFINPGVLPALDEASQQSRFNRSFEYDALGDRYARFLIEEILPEVGKSYNLTSDPNLRAIGGSSSGGIAAFTAAWNRPDAFRRVLSFIGSYTNLRGGDIYSGLVRKTEPKPLRVFLQDGNRDQNIYSGNWWIANNDLAIALEYAGYDAKFVTGTEGHNANHGSAILPDALRWLWRDWTTPIANLGGDSPRHYIKEILTPGKDWELLGSGYQFTEGPAVDKQGNVFFTDLRASRIHKITPDGKVSVFKEDTGGANGLMFGPDGRLYACQNGRKKIVAYSMDGTEETIATDAPSNDLAITAKGEIYFTDPGNKKVWFIDRQRNKRIVHEGIEFPNGVVLSPDQSLLNVVDMRGKWVWSFQILPNGDLANGQPFFRLETPDQSSQSLGDGMTMDTLGHLYVATAVGIQICDPPGRVVGIINNPQSGWTANVVFGGPGLDWLYVTASDKVYRRQLRRKGAVPWSLVKPERPRL